MDPSTCENLQQQPLSGISLQPTNCLSSDPAGSASSCGSSNSGPITFEASITKIESQNQVNPEQDTTCGDGDDDDNDNDDDSDNDDDDVEDENQEELDEDDGGHIDSPAGKHINELASNNIEQSGQQRWQQHQLRQQQPRQKDFHRDLDDVKQVELFGVRIVALTINGKDRLCLAQISNTLLKEFSYNEIHNRRVALGITCIQCTPIQLEMLRRAGAMPSSSRRCGMITMREAERLCRSFLVEEQPPELPDNFYFTVAHRVNYGCRGRFVPARYISSRAKCIECFYCGEFYSPNKFIFHSHRQPNTTDCNPPDSPNINSWRKHIDLDWTQEQGQEIRYAWEDVKSLFNGGTRRRAHPQPGNHNHNHNHNTGIQHQSSSSSAAAIKAVITSSQVGQRKSTTSSSQSGRQGRFVVAATLADDDEQDHIDVVCDEPTTAIILTEPQNMRNSLIGRDNSDDLCKPRAAATHLQQQQQQQRISTKRSLSGTVMQPQSKRPSSNHHTHRNQSSILGDSQAASYKTTGAGADSHTSSRVSLGAFSLPVANQLRAQNNTGSNRFNGIDFSSPTAASRRPAAPIGGNRLEKPINSGSHYGAGSNNNPLLIAPDTNFIHSQLYSQLMQPQQQQQQLQAHQKQQQQQLQLQGLPETIDAQVAIRHHLWTSLLANLQCNFATNNHQIYSIAQQQQAMGAAAAAAARMPDISATNNGRSSIDHLLASYPQVGTAKLISNPQTEINLNNFTASQ